MKLQRNLITAVAAGAIFSAAGAQAGGIGYWGHGQGKPEQNQDSPDWYSDQALKTYAPFFGYYHHGKTTFPVLIKNAALESSQGSHRLLIHSHRKVLNADGYSDQGVPYVEVCGDGCEMGAGGYRLATVQVQARPWDWFFFIPPYIDAQNQPFKLQLLHNADMDGTGGALQNAVSFSALMGALKEEYPDNTVILSSGDNFIPGPRFQAAADPSLAYLLGEPGEGRADIALMNAMGYQASAVGNHDLDSGTAGFAGIISQEFGENGFYPGAQFPYLSATLNFTTDANLAPLVVANGLPASSVPNSLAAYSIIEVAGKIIGVVGATTPILDQITSTGDIEVLPEDADDIAALAAQIQASVDQLTAMGVSKVIMLAHMQQIAIEKELATLLDGVDIIVAGGSNTLLADSNDVLLPGDTAADTYPLQLTSASGEPVLVVNTDGDYKYLGRLVSQFDLSGRILTQRLDSSVNGAYANDPEVLEALGNPSPNAEVAAISEAVSAILAERDGNIFGKSSVFLDGRRNQVRTQETNLGDLSADANLWTGQMVDPSVQVSIKNGGGIRDDIGYFAYPPGSTNPEDLQYYPTAPNPSAGKLEGDISQFDIQNSLRFNNELSLVSVTAETLLALIEHGVAATEDGATPGQFPQVGGIRFSYDPALPPGSRVNNLVIVNSVGTIVDIIAENGVLMGDPSRVIRVVTLNFLAGGGDGYPFPQDASADRLDIVGSGLLEEGEINFAAAGSEQDAMAEYLNAFYADTPFAQAETDMANDLRIQNLSKRSDTIFD